MKRGYTLVELLVVIVIALIIAGLAITSLSNIRERNKLTDARDNVHSQLRLARNNTLASKDASQYGVYLDADEATYFKGNDYASSIETRTYNVPNGVSISGISLEGGGNEIVFERLTGETDEFGSITISNDADPENASSTIRIFSTGVMEIEL